MIDTPGHADFIAEVERAFGVLDGAVLVLSAVEGIQAQTKLLMAVLEKLAIPVILFVNKIDRSGAQPEAVCKAIRERLSRCAIPLYGTVQAGTKQANIVKNSAARRIRTSMRNASSWRPTMMNSFSLPMCTAAR